MKSLYQQEFEDKLNQGFEYTIWIGTNRWMLSKMHSTGRYVLSNAINQITIDTPKEAVFYLLLEEIRLKTSARWLK